MNELNTQNGAVETHEDRIRFAQENPDMSVNTMRAIFKLGETQTRNIMREAGIDLTSRRGDGSNKPRTTLYPAFAESMNGRASLRLLQVPWR